MSDTVNYVGYAADIVSAYVSNNTVAAADLPALIGSVHKALVQAAAGPAEEPAAELKPATSIKKSVSPDYIVCLEDGKKFKSLKRHLRTAYEMTPGEYRAKWSLPSDYPMVAPNYTAARSALAKKMGLGQLRAKAAAAAAAAPTPVKRSRRKAA